jgi:hypothetical protein
LRTLIVAVLAGLCVCSSAAAASRFRPRIGGAMGIIPAAGHQEIASGSAIPVVYHGGAVMRGVTVHTIFWAPSGYRFDGPPTASAPGYKQVIQRFLTDVAHDSGTAGNVFSVLPSYPDQTGPGSYNIAYNPATDSIDAADPYPPSGQQCPSPAGIAACVTDLQVQREIDKLIRARAPRARGLHDVWFVFLPPDVDTCTSIGVCGTNAYAGYHALSNFGAGPVIYAAIPDPLIEQVPPPGSDPQGNPEGEAAVDVTAHELAEAITDPEGAGWMDPNGFETGDKCESGPQHGTPLGYALNGSPYNQVINGDQYLIQGMWSNAGLGCTQRTTGTTSALPLATVNLGQFNPQVSGGLGVPVRGVPVTVLLARAGNVIAGATTTSRAGGAWGPVSLQSLDSPGRHAVGDDRDEILVRYGRGGPRPDLIEVGSGGNPFTAAGWTSWTDLDSGYRVGKDSLVLAPCSQTGVLVLTVGGVSTDPPIEHCETESDLAVVRTRNLGFGSSLRFSSQDNRAVSQDNPDGALVRLTIALGEPGSVSATGNRQVQFDPTGFPLCSADLQAQSVRCTGLVPGERYTMTRGRRHAVRHARADSRGTIVVRRFPGRRGIEGGDLLILTNRARRRLTALHVAHLRVDVHGAQGKLASGRCQPDEYYGPPPTAPSPSLAVGLGLSGSGTICPASGRARGLPATGIVQSDEFSGGTTRTEIPTLTTTSPLAGEIVYGPFVALAQTSSRARVAVSITRLGSRRSVFRARDVNTFRGTVVRALPAGVYAAKWVVTDVNGDTRTVQTRFVEFR